MKLGTKIGWILVAFSIVLSIWVISGIGTKANQTDADGFEVDDNGQLVSYSGAGGAITIPANVGGVQVTSIAGGVFSNNGNAQNPITSVVMSDTITSMGSAVFSGSDISAITLSENLTTIPEKTFYQCDSLSNIDLKNVTTIGSLAFYQSGLTTVTIPASVAGISTDAFDECSSLTAINVDAANGNFTSYDGCLYNLGGTNLIRCPEGKSTLNLASTCTSIGNEALKNCNLMSSVSIPATVTSIGTQTNWAPDEIVGTTGSAAETFAQNNGIRFVATGENSGSTDSGSTDSSTTDSSSSSTTSGTYYTVSFNLNGGSGTSTQQKVLAGGHATNPGDPTKQGCTFMGWDYGSAAGDLWNFATYTVNGNVTLTAVWKNPDGSIDKGTKTTKSGGSSGSGGHVKDSTPKTADGDLDPRYFLSLSFLLVGVAAILYSKRQKMQMIADRRNR